MHINIIRLGQTYIYKNKRKNIQYTKLNTVILKYKALYFYLKQSHERTTCVLKYVFIILSVCNNNRQNCIALEIFKRKIKKAVPAVSTKDESNSQA